MLKNLKSSGWLIGLLVIGGLLFLLFGGGLGGGNDVPVTGRQGAQGDLGRIFAASDLDRDGCPVDTTTRFVSNETIYVGLEESDLPRGTRVFARLYYDGRPLEDTNEITADRDMRNTCVWFQFEPRGGFDPGQYEAEIVINGNPADQVALTVEGSGRQGGLLNRGNRAEIGRVYTTTGVTERGCPVDDVNQFYSDETIYLSAENSFIPAGTEVFARLIYEGEAIEDTDPIRADRDMQSCVWFAFEPRRGFDPGRYEAELFVDGNVVEVVPFEVR